MRAERISDISETGRAKNARKLPSASIIELKKFAPA
jgi:hypothetical protein